MRGSKRGFNRSCRGLIVAASVALAPFSGEANAQVVAKPFPNFRTSDPVNVDIATGLPHWTVPDVAIGPADPEVGLHHSTSSYLASYLNPQDGFWGGITANNTSSLCNQTGTGSVAYAVAYGDTGECFRQFGSVWTSNGGKGTIFEVLGGGLFLYTLADGTRIHISSAYTLPGHSAGAVTKVVAPDGTTTDIIYDVQPSTNIGRIRFVSRNNGFRLHYRYLTNSPADPNWHKIQSVVAFNAAYVPCDLTQSTCAIGADWPTASYARTSSGSAVSVNITNAGGETIRFKHNTSLDIFGRYTSIQLPSSSVDNYTYTYCPQGPNCSYLPPGQITYISVKDMVVQASRDGQVWQYGMSPAGPYGISRTSTGPTGYVMNMFSNLEGHIHWINRPDGNLSFTGNEANRIHTVAWPQGNTTSYGRDARGNLTQTLHTPASGSAETPLSETASYSAACTNRITCNRPESQTDANGNTTVFTYDPGHGGVVKSTGPSVNGVDLETRYVYVQRYASYLNSTGAVVQDPNPIWLPAEERYCRTGAASGFGCAIPGDEVVTRYEYGPTTGVNNLLLRGVVRDATGLAARTCYGYDRYGNRISETTPNANLASCP